MIQKLDFFHICNINQHKSQFLKSKIKSKSLWYKLHSSSMLFAVMTKFKEHLLKTWFSDPFSMLFHYELLCELLQLQFQSQTKIPCYSLWNLCFSNILLWQPKDKLTKQTKVNMKVTFPVMSYLSSSEKKAWKKNSGLYGIFFFFFFFSGSLLQRFLSYSHLYPQFKYMTFIYSQPFKIKQSWKGRQIHKKYTK